MLPQFGREKLSAITGRTLQDLVDRLAAQGLAPSTILNTLLPLRAIYRRSLSRGEVALNPTQPLLAGGTVEVIGDEYPLIRVNGFQAAEILPEMMFQHGLSESQPPLEEIEADHPMRVAFRRPSEILLD